MNKECPHCSHELSKSDFRQFLKDKVGDWMICKRCEGKIYIVLPEQKRISMILLNILAVLPVFIFMCLVSYLLFASGLVRYSSSDASLHNIITKIYVAIVVVTIVAVLTVATFASRAIHWKLAVAQKSPFV